MGILRTCMGNGLRLRKHQKRQVLEEMEELGDCRCAGRLAWVGRVSGQQWRNEGDEGVVAQRLKSGDACWPLWSRRRRAMM